VDKEADKVYPRYDDIESDRLRTIAGALLFPEEHHLSPGFLEAVSLSLKRYTDQTDW
jgi:hypothetical protein